jgi:hypothetical protein
MPYYCRIIAGELQALEHEKLFWCHPGRFDELPWAAADEPILLEIALGRSS